MTVTDETEMATRTEIESVIGMVIAMVVEETVIETGTVIEIEIDMVDEMNFLGRGIMMVTAMRIPVPKEGIKHSILNTHP
jgi:hypothetical protein